MAGFQELFIIIAIFLGVFFIPRMMSRRAAPAKAGSNRGLNWKLRLAIAVSVVYLFAAGAYLKPWQRDPMAYLYVGIVPIAVGWLVIWVVAGFKKK